MDMYFLTPIVMYLIIGGISAWKIISRKQSQEDREKMLRSNSQRSSEILKEQFAKREINQEKFDKLSNQIDYNKQKKHTIIIIAIVLCGIAIAFAIKAYYYYTIDCDLSLSHYPSWYNTTYLLKCENHEPFI